MKKQLLTMLCVVTIMTSGVAFADTHSASAGDVTVTVNSQSAATVKANAAAMKVQINAIQSKLNSISTIQRNAIENLAANLLPTEQVKALKTSANNLKTIPAQKSAINITISEDGTISLNNFAKTPNMKNKLQNLTTSQKTAIKRDLQNLSTARASYAQVLVQSKQLLVAAQNDPVAALTLKADIANLIKTQKTIMKQNRDISKLTSNINKAATKAGVTLK